MTFAMKTVPDGFQITWGDLQINLDRLNRCVGITNAKRDEPVVYQVVAEHGSPSFKMTEPKVGYDVIVSSSHIDADIVRRRR